MRTSTIKDLPLLQFELLADCPRIVHASTTRQGGDSTGIFTSFNLGSDIGDDDVVVERNRQKFRSALGIDSFHEMLQKHGTQTQVITGASPLYLEGDAMITDVPGKPLLIKHADCQAGIFYDPIRHVIANVHCGWRGNVANIYGHVIEKMKNQFGCHPEDLLVGVSPSLGPDAAEFIHYKDELPESFWEYQVKPNYFDLWEVSKAQLREAGVIENHIEVAGLCTYSDEERFFSYRRNKRTGRLGTIVMLSV